ncbi:MAG TPA: Gfo/Idh/MocA family oxidoreductase [Actinomycetota bacterium]|jgi:predicted dehydrogenase
MSIRVALFGCGWIQDFHARGVRAHPDGELVAVANHREETAHAFAERHEIERVTTDWRTLAADPAVDAAIVATPNALHAPQAVELLRAGKHVLVEKPMATSVAECDAMIQAAAEGSASLMVAHCWRFHDDVRALGRRIEAGELGEIVKTRGYGVHVDWGPSGWFVDPELAGGGALVDMGVHAIDTARFLLGDPVPERVCAAIGTRYAAGRYEVDDDGVVLITWSNGTTSLVECGWWQPHRGGPEADTEVYGTRGYDRVWPAEAPADDELGLQPMYSAQVGEFLDAVGEGRRPRPSGEDGRIVMQVVERAYASALEAHAT